MSNWAPMPNQFSDKRWPKVPLKGDNTQIDLQATNHPWQREEPSKKAPCLAFCNTAAMITALFIVGQLIQSSTSEETRLAAAAILLQCQKTQKKYFSVPQGEEQSQSLR